MKELIKDLLLAILIGVAVYMNGTWLPSLVIGAMWLLIAIQGRRIGLLEKSTCGKSITKEERQAQYDEFFTDLKNNIRKWP